MNHKEQHHQHHEKEREHRKKERKAREGKGGWPIHPGWLLVVGIAGTLITLILWIFFMR